MRSIMIFAVLVAAVGFTGCRGTGRSCPLGHGGCMLGKRAAKATSATSDCGCDQGSYMEAGGCGCDGGTVEYAPADGGCGCGCDSVMSVSGATDCGCGASGYDVAPVVNPVQFSAPVQHSAPSSGGCSACQGASVGSPGGQRGLLTGKGLSGRCLAGKGLAGKGFGKARVGDGGGIGLAVNDRGLACNSGPERRAQRQAARSLKPRGLKGKLGFGATDETYEEFDLVSDEYVVGCDECSSGISGRRISHGFISDIREARGGRGHIAGGGGCGRGGCGLSGGSCGACSKIRGLAGLGSGNPYGGAIPHTAQGPGQSGLAPAYAYPYYTTRGPRDFLIDNPPSIGR